MSQRKETVWILAIAFSACLVATVALTAKKEPGPEVFPLEEVRAGMKGYGLTVFSGREPEKFDVEVIGVLRQFLPRQDLILVRCSHPVLDHAGVVAGMSGSPIYLNGKLAGALAYAWRYAKDPIAGVTPAADMISYLDMATNDAGERGKGSPSRAATQAGKHVKGKLFSVLPQGMAWMEAVEASLPLEGAEGMDYWERFSDKGGGRSDLIPVVTPLAGSLLQRSEIAAAIEKLFGKFFMVPVPTAASMGVGKGNMVAESKATQGRGGMTEGGKERKKPSSKGGRGGIAAFRPGEPVAIQFVRGDVDLSASGTVTVVAGKKVLAFGHPLNNFGSVEIPASAAYVHHSMASLLLSFKMTEPGEEIGALVLDRQAGILIEEGRRPRVIPLRVKLREREEGREETWSMEVLHHRLLTPSLLRIAITNAVDRFSPDTAGAVVEARYEIAIGGHKPLALREKVYQPTGTLSLAYSERLSSALQALLQNNFEEVRIEGVRAEIDLDYGQPFAVIRGAYLSSDSAEEGDLIEVFVIVQELGGGELLYSTRVKVPPGTEWSKLSVKIEPGDKAAPEVVAPHDLEDVIENLGKSFPPDCIVVSLQLPSQGISIGGKIIERLPPSVLDTLRPKAAYLGEQPEAVVERKLICPGIVTDGRVELELNVKGRERR